MNWKVTMIRVFVFVAILLFVVDTCGSVEPVFFRGHNVAPAKKPLVSTDDNKNDIRGDNIGSCSKDDILIFQNQTPPLYNGIPTYSVNIENVCTAAGSCSISGIHLRCGWFGSVTLIEPAIFKRLAYDDCLVNDGKPLNAGQTISFVYANTFMYPLSVASAVCN